MKYRAIALAAGLLAAHTAANAWFFFFIPGSVTSAIADKIRGQPVSQSAVAAGNIECVEPTVGFGDRLTVPGKGLVQVTRIVGRHEACSIPERPVLAEVAPTQ